MMSGAKNAGHDTDDEAISPIDRQMPSAERTTCRNFRKAWKTGKTVAAKLAAISVVDFHI
jgi:hypothetical protein